MDELVASYRNFVRTDDVDLTAARQLGELQIKPEARIEFKISRARHLEDRLQSLGQSFGAVRS
jgi:hypothetical protein